MRFNKTLLKGSIVLSLAFGIFNLLNFVYQLIMARMLSVVDYGTLVALLSITYVFFIFTEPVQTLIAKQAATEYEKGKLKNLLRRSQRKGAKVSLLLFVAFSFFSLFLSPLLKIPISLILLTGVTIFFVFSVPINLGILQGRKRFNSFGINLTINSVFKLCLAVLLVGIGFGVYGALIGILFGSLIALFFSFYQLRDITSSHEKPMHANEIYTYTKPTFVLMLAFLIFFNLDVLIAKVVFDPESAGMYAIASILAKTVYFGTQPIGKALFPISSSEKSKVKQRRLFINAFTLHVILAFVALLCFLLFPDLIVRLFSGKMIPEASSILFFLGVAMFFQSLTNLFLFYKLSVGSTRRYPLLLSFFALEAILLILFRANLVQYSFALVFASALFLLGSVIILRKKVVSEQNKP